MKRWALGPVLAALLVVVACQPTPPPSSWVPPSVDPLELSVETITPGSPFTVSLRATDDRGISDVSLSFAQPHGATGRFVECRLGNQVGLFFELPSPQRLVELELTCQIPFGKNGPWTVAGVAYDDHGTGRGEPVTLGFTGGTEDVQPPVVESIVVPVPPISGQWFDVVVTVSDDGSLEPVPTEPTMGYTGRHMNSYGRECFDPQLRALSPTLHEWTFSCQANSDGLSGTYDGGMTVYDATGNYADARFEFEMLPPQ